MGIALWYLHHVIQWQYMLSKTHHLKKKQKPSQIITSPSFANQASNFRKSQLRLVLKKNELSHRFFVSAPFFGAKTNIPWVFHQFFLATNQTRFEPRGIRHQKPATRGLFGQRTRWCHHRLQWRAHRGLKSWRVNPGFRRTFFVGWKYVCI